MITVEQLASLEEIRQAKARYFRCVDTKDWEGLRTVFTQDVVFDRTYGHSVQDPWSGAWTPPIAAEPQLVEGVDAVIALIRSVVEPIRTVHNGYTPEITFKDDETASVIWPMSDELRDRQDRLILAGRGHYHETYRRTGQGWRIAYSKLTRLSLIHGDGRRDQGD